MSYTNNNVTDSEWKDNDDMSNSNKYDQNDWWEMEINILLELLTENVLRFNELHRLINGISQRVLTRQLRELESDGLVNRKIYPVVPPKVEYSLTVDGKNLQNIFEALHQWSTNKKNNTNIQKVLEIK